MNRVFLLQTEIGIPDPWDDSLNMANVNISPGLGYSNNPSGYENYISFFQKVDNRFSITGAIYPEHHLLLKKPFSIHDPSTEIPLNFDDIADTMDNTKDNIAMLGAILNAEIPDQRDVISKTSWYHRVDDAIIDLITGDKLEHPKMIPWLFCYKARDLPLYYIILNPHSVQCIENIEAKYGINHVFTISNHLKNLNETIFKPRVSKNARIIGENNIMVRGDQFTIEPFKSWFVDRNIPGFFDSAKIKVDTNFDYTMDGNKIIVNTLNKQKGYIGVRWNTGTIMDMTFTASKNRFFREYIVDVIE